MIINLDEKQLNIIGKYLGQAPFNEVAQLIHHINSEVQNNFNASAETVPVKAAALAATRSPPTKA